MLLSLFYTPLVKITAHTFFLLAINLLTLGIESLPSLSIE